MQVETRVQNDSILVELAGDWTLESPLPRFDQVLNGQNGRPAIHTVAFDASKLGNWDSSLLTFLLQGMDYCEDHQLRFADDTLPENIKRLIALSRAVPERVTEKDDPNPSLLERVGRTGLAIYESFLGFAAFTGELMIALVNLLRGRSRMRWRDFGWIIQSNSSGAFFIVALISFLAGLIISFLAAVVLLRFGAEYYVSYLVSYGMLRELGALMTAIIMAGRTGAAFAAELGTMKVTEEIDALVTLGISPVDYLVLPRVLAVFLMMPLLTLYADFIGILGGLFVTITMMDISVARFFTGLLEPVAFSDALLGVFKAAVYGYIIGMSGCLRGLQTGNDAGAVGQAATSAVVTGITLIIMANALIDWAAALLNV